MDRRHRAQPVRGAGIEVRRRIGGAARLVGADHFGQVSVDVGEGQRHPLGMADGHAGGAVSSLPEGAGDPGKGLMPKGAVQSVTSFGKGGFGGACPPAGDRAHRYIFTVYALDVASLPLDAAATPALVGYMLNAHAIAKASLIAYYGR